MRNVFLKKNTMKKIVLFLLFVSAITFAQTTTSPSPAIATGSVTINFNKTGTPLATYTGTIYAHIGITVNGTQWQDVKGTWGNNTTQPALTTTDNTNYSLTLGPDLYTYFNIPTTSSITQICVVFRGAAGSPQTTDTFLSVGAFQMTLSSPVENSYTIFASSANASIVASNTSGPASYVLKANGTIVSGPTSTTFFTAGPLVTQNTVFTLECTQGSTTFIRKFTYIINPNTVSQALPSGIADDGITYNSSDPTTATLVLTAPNKDFVYVAGSFNNWAPTTNYAMKKDPTTGKFWLQLTGLTSGQVYTYQYWVCKTTPTVTNSPKVVKVADPYSTLVLSPYDDPYIPATKYPNLPAYPTGQEKEVTVLQTGQTPYNWQVTNFTKPEKDNLVIYEVLVRDFDADMSYQNLIDRIDYFKNLKINAIELMPVMEYEGNQGWGYNPIFHLAADKFYGPADKLKQFIDLCHQNGIAVILDVALNHAFGRNSLERMWMVDATGTGFGDVSSENPYFNVTATHSYGVGYDFNHSAAVTKYYTKRVIKQWIQEFKIDGFRWDLTKGFTQACPPTVSGGQDACTNGYQQDRVDILKEYADYSWSVDPTHYVIFEHLGIDSEEQQWANYRVSETPSKGVMLWGKMTDQYNQLTMGYNSSNDISRMGSSSRGFTNNRLVGYAESHDEERLMYKNVTYGNSSNSSHNVTNLNTALSRMSAMGAVSLLIPGPKMIWHFGDLGYNSSLYTCNDGTLNTASDATAGDCRLDTKPQPQWTNNWLTNTNRSQIYNDWARMIDMKKNFPVFKGSYAINSGTTLQPKIYIYDNSIPSTSLKNVVVLSNFDVTTQNVVPNFPYTGTWYDLMTNTPINVTDVAATISIAAGQFKIYGNQPAALNNEQFNALTNISLYPNPSNGSFMINSQMSKVEVYSVTGQMVKTFTSIPSENFIFDISSLDSGIYLVKAIDANNNSKTMKLIKQ